MVQSCLIEMECHNTSNKSLQQSDILLMLDMTCLTWPGKINTMQWSHDGHEPYSSGYQPFIVTHFNIIVMTFDDWF